MLLRRSAAQGATDVVPFLPRETGAAPGGAVEAGEFFVTGVGSSTTYPDYKPAPFIVSSKADGVDVVTVVTEGIFSYCSVRVKIDTDRFLGPEQANFAVKEILHLIEHQSGAFGEGGARRHRQTSLRC